MPVRLLFLDRDGTLNRTFAGRPPNTPDQVELLPGVGETLLRYVADGWQLVVVTNQGGVANGYLTEAQAYAVQRQVIDLLPVPVTASYLCPHMPDAVVPEYALDCPNRKPRPGFILTALCTFGAVAGDCLFVGDAITDQEAARAAGVPYCWADRFFGRPIDRGMRARDGQWVQIREAPANGEAVLCLQAWRRDQEMGHVSLRRGQASSASFTGEVTLDVDARYRDAGIGPLLMAAALEWASEQPGLEKV